jgi:V/A-type H+-transporting ATPase subunit I
MLRPRPARWFEALCPRAEGARVVALLARTGAVEVELRPTRPGDLRLQELSEGLAAYRQLLPPYGPYWSRGTLLPPPGGAPPRRMLQRALERIERWRQDADPLIERLQSLEDERFRIGLCARVMEGLDDSHLDFSLLVRCGPFLQRLAAILPGHGILAGQNEAVLHLTVPLDADTYLLAVGPELEIAALTKRVRALGGRLLQPPPWLEGPARHSGDLIRVRCDALDREIEQLYGRLDRLFEVHTLAGALGDLSALEWFVSRVGVLELASDRFALVTGWTDDPDGTALIRALDRDRAPILIHFPVPPTGSEPPQLLDNPAWVQPFELFARAMGVPGGNEADPSALLAVIVPLLFGYMFGDLGQGLVLLTVGWALRNRFALGRLIMAGGASAALFGWVFGSLFSVEHLFPPLWLHPLGHPITVLAAPLVLAVLLLALGQLLNALQAAWGGRLRAWLWTDAGFLLMYLGAALAALLPQLAWLPVAGIAWFLIGNARLGGPLHAVKGLGELVERALQLLVNTLSFARVGAFALAHAGLSSALVSLAQATGSAWGTTLVLVVGNLVVILLEGLVVSIQTTRLVLFEFFTRFLQGTGRVFRPLPAPPTIVRGET